MAPLRRRLRVTITRERSKARYNHPGLPDRRGPFLIGSAEAGELRPQNRRADLTRSLSLYTSRAAQPVWSVLGVHYGGQREGQEDPAADAAPLD
jgi:hypothetical protein